MKILLLGNGFDIFHKLPTKYQNFLHTVNFLKDNYNGTINTIGDVFSNKALCDSDICGSYELYKEYYDKTSLDSEKIDRLISLSKNNMWFSYLYNSYNDDLNWIDFEKEIANVLNEFEEIFKIHNSLSNKQIVSISLSDEFKKTRYILDCFSFFHQEYKNGVNVNYYYRKINPDYMIEEPYGSGIYDINKNKVINEMYLHLRELADMLKLYLECFVDSITDRIRNDDTILPGLNIYDATHVCTLNYTKTFEKLYDDQKVFHIHGNIDNDIVLGINADKNDELPNINTDFLCFKKYYQRVFYRTDMEYQKFNIAMDKYVNSPYQKDDSVYVIGHSLDITDAEIIKNIFNRTCKIIVFHHDEYSFNDHIKNLIEMYGKEGFDKLVTERNLEFRSLTEIEVKKQ